MVLVRVLAKSNWNMAIYRPKIPKLGWSFSPKWLNRMKILFCPLNLLEIPLPKKGIRSNSICEELSQFGLKVGPKKSKNEVLAEKLRKAQPFL